VRNRGLAIGACALAVVTLAIGLVFKNQADFSRHYVGSQLTEHGISFTPVANLLPQQKKIPCLVRNAGKPMKTGKQAECYAKYQIGIDLTLIDNGKNYFQSHYNGYLARMKAYGAMQKSPNDPATLALMKEADRIQRISDDLLAGEATKGLLLTGYGFSVIGDRLALGATVCFILTAVLLLAAVAIFMMSGRKRPAAT